MSQSGNTILRAFVIVVSVSSAAGISQAQSVLPAATFVKAIGGVSRSSNPSHMTDVGGIAFLSACTAATGCELWKSDGTSAGTVLVRDIFPGTTGSSPSAFTDVNGAVFFVATDPAAGLELWKSDGTQAGTIRVKDIAPGPGDSRPANLTNVNGTLYFTAEDDAGGEELWKSDGTEAGTVRVKDITPGPQDSGVAFLTNVNGTLFFRASDPAAGFELWTSDGTEQGTQRVTDTVPGPDGSFPSSFLSFKGALFFTQADETSGRELWKSDGTGQGTVRVKDIAPGMASSAPEDLTAVGGMMFFIATGLQGGRELWKSDGTAAGTLIVKNMPSGPANPFSIDLVSHAGAIFFIVQVSDVDFELWRSDGSAIGTGPVVGSLHIAGRLTSVNQTLFFSAVGTGVTPFGSGIELWTSDGTAHGTVTVKDIRRGFVGSNPDGLANIHGSLFFAADDGDHGVELWKSDGTEPGTTIVADVDPIRDLTAYAFLNVNGPTFFVANDRTFDAFWKTDGTAAGTVKVKNIEISGGPSATGSSTRKPGPRFVNFGGTLLFSATDGSSGHELWRSDGTGAGTVLVKDIWPGIQPFIAEPNSGAPTELTVFGNAVFFAADDGSGLELWRSDGTGPGTTRVTTARAVADHVEGPKNLTAINGTLFFSREEPDRPLDRLWKSDGTTSGTVQIGSNLGPRELTPIGDTLYFADGFDLWKSDGTQAGTSLIKSIFITGPIIPGPLPKPGVYAPFDELTDVNGTLFFKYAGRLWKSDGTASGTVSIKDLGMFAFAGLTNVNGTVFFAASDAGGGRELWKSDGTEAGTLRVKDIALGTQDSMPASLTSIGGRLLFSATDGVHGRELWVSDGTDAGTFMVRDVWPGPTGSSPENLEASADVLYFTAADPLRGRQLWKATLLTPTSTDTDGDGLSNVWETNFGFSPTSAAGNDGPNGDPDLDGRTNLEEYIDGTHPRSTATLAVDRTTLQFGAVGSINSFLMQTPAQAVLLTQDGSGALSWLAVADQPWVHVSPSTGNGSSELSIAVAPGAGLSASGGMASIRFFLTGSDRPFHQIAVTLRLTPAGTSSAPIGFVDTPLDNTTGVTGAIPFTGWALDDVEVTRVMVCRAAVAGEVAPADPNCGGAAQIFVGFGTFIDGARTDVAAAYPTFPVNTRAGWGFMVLTNMLPNQGNGTYQFFMYAQDRDGHTTLLGTRTLTSANASATKPFGAIDTPTQGGPASGAGFINFGWALTPQPKIIPINGSTMTVMVDGVPLGPVDYNHERPDIEALFPGFQNTTGANGAVGFRVIDTTTLSNGLHTISWTVTDSLGVTEGIGSRFFTVTNGSGAVTAAVEGAASSRVRATAEIIGAAPQDEAPVLARRGWDLEAPWQLYGVGGAGRVVIRGEEVDRFELALGEHEGARYTGYLRVGEELAPLPIGSQLDATTGQFTWAPGVGFIGRYDLVFVRWAGPRAVVRHEVRVILAPKGSGHVGVQVAIDTPRSQQDVGQPFVLAGWAADLDAAAGTGIDTLHVWAYPSAGGAPVFLGTPTLGGARPDVAAIHGDQFRTSGFGLTLQGLAPGTYDLAVFPWSNVTGTFAPPSVVQLTVR